MSAKVVLAVGRGPRRGESFTFTEEARCTVGRAADCAIQFPDDDEHDAISSHHCELAVDPPRVRVRDLSSRNGTFLNGVLIGRRDADDPDATVQQPFPVYELGDGDELGIGPATTLVVRISPPRGPAAGRARRQARSCPNCGRPIAGERGGGTDPSCPGCDRDSGLLLREGARRARESRAGGESSSLDPLAGLVLVRRLGLGSTGAVWLCVDGAGSEIALKIIRPELAADRHRRLLFSREIATMRQLAHPHVARIDDDGSCLGRPFFTGEYCDAGSLADLLAATEDRGATLPVGEAVEIALHVLDALDYAHGAPVRASLAGAGEAEVVGIVHRDVTPGNILFRREGAAKVVKLSDFGLAKAFETAGLSRLTRSGPVNLVGTPGYLPRQQAVDLLHAGPEVDVYAAAACLYRMLTGATPRDLPGGARGIRLLQERPPPVVPVRERNRDVPVRLARAVEAALVDTPAIEITSAAELRSLLLACA